MTWHIKVKKTAGVYGKRHNGFLCDSNEQITYDSFEKLKSWKEYVSTLYNDDRVNDQPNNDILEGPPIIREEVEYALKNVKIGKATGPNEILVYVLKPENTGHINGTP